MSGDFNGDGRADILWQNDDGQQAVWLMSGPQVLASGAVLHMGVIDTPMRNLIPSDREGHWKHGGTLS